MTSASKKKAGPARRVPRANLAALCRRHPVRAFTILGALLLAAAGVGYYWTQRSVAPQIPAVQEGTVGADAELAIAGAAADVRSHPESVEAWGKLACVFFAYGLEAQAQVCFDRAETFDRDDPHWPYYRGLIEIKSNPDLGIVDLQRALRLSGHPSARLRLAETLLANGQDDEAEALLRQVLQTQPTNDRACLGLGQLAARHGDLATAVTLLKRAAASPFSQRAAQVALGAAYLRLGDTRAAERAQQQVASLPPDPVWPDPLMQRVEHIRFGTHTITKQANELVKRGQPTQAIALLKNWLQGHPDADQAAIALAGIYMDVGNGQAAERVLRPLWKLKPNSVRVPFLLARSLALQNDNRGAAEFFRETIKIKPDEAFAHYNLGVCLATLGDRPGAIAELRLALKYRPDLVTVHNSLADLLAKSGQKAEALEHLHDALRLAPNDPKAKELLTNLKSR